MAKDFSRKFYDSQAWRDQRELCRKLSHGLCARCGKPGVIVHHKQPLTPDNINDPMVSLNQANLELVCRDCHKRIHDSIEVGGYFDEYGDLHKA